MIDTTLNKIKSVVDARYLSSSTLYIKDNNANYYSIMVRSNPSLYHLDVGDHLFARVKLKGKAKYISFGNAYEHDLIALGIPYTSIKSEEFVRIDLDYFLGDAILRDDVRALLNTIYASSFNYPSFGCCGKYNECSDAGHCLHADILYASAACQYKRNLDAGRVFYGQNAVK